MQSITYSQIQQLVTELPQAKLPLAYRLLSDLAVKEAGVDEASPQLAFVHLPVEERRRMMARQAEAMVQHYEETANERLEWQSGDFIDES